jgi:hypothetical protein
VSVCLSVCVTLFFLCTRALTLSLSLSLSLSLTHTHTHIHTARYILNISMRSPITHNTHTHTHKHTHTHVYVCTDGLILGNMNARTALSPNPNPKLRYVRARACESMRVYACECVRACVKWRAVFVCATAHTLTYTHAHVRMRSCVHACVRHVHL